VCFCDRGYYGDDCAVRESIRHKAAVTADMAARSLCENICVHGKCLPTAPKANFSVFRHRLNRDQTNLTDLARNASQYYACFCEPNWSGVRCSRSLVTCPAECLDSEGVCRKDCEYSNTNACPIYAKNKRMCGGRRRGKCNAKTGECQCVAPYHGMDCGTASCPNDCSGHGMCNTHTTKCLCYAGWTGGSCDIRLED